MAVVAIVVAAIIVIGRSVFVPLLVGYAVSALLEPLMRWLQKRGVSSRPLAAILAMLSAIVFITLVLVFLLPTLFHQLEESYTRIPLAFRAVIAKAQEFIQWLRTHLSSDAFEQLNDYTSQFTSNPSSITTRVSGWLSRGLQNVLSLGSSVVDLVLIPFFIYYMLLDLRLMTRFIRSRIPERHRETGTELIEETTKVVTSYIRGRVLIAMIMACIYALGLAILKVPLAIAIGLIAGIVGIIPYLGVLTGLLLAFGFAALGGAGLGSLIGVGVVFAIAQTLEDYVLTPRIVGEQLKLHPMAVFIAIIVAGDLFGLIGLIVAIPITGVLKVWLEFFDRLYLRSDFYNGQTVGESTEKIPV